MTSPLKIRIDFEPLGKRVEIQAGSTLLDAARLAGIGLIAVCGGKGTCGQCRVRIMAGPTERPAHGDKTTFTDEQLSAGWRLACQTTVYQSMKVFIPPESLTTPQRLQVESTADAQTVSSSFSVEDVALDPTKTQEIPQPFAWSEDQAELNQLLHAALVVRDGKIRLVKRSGKTVSWCGWGDAVYGLAVDLGTTKIAVYLVELLTGETIAHASAMNPQIAYGEDVISRILYCMENPDGQELLQRLVVETINELIQTLCVETGAVCEQIVEAVVVANTAMHHLFLHLPVRQLGLSPYHPAISHAVAVRASELGLALSPHGRVYLPENIAGYVGGDHVAMMIATQVSSAEDTAIALDIGTNTEISLVSHGRIYTCSCASGPAFEGAHIEEGMRAAEGAIERILIRGDCVQYQTIGDIPPVGICGSGILDAVAELRSSEIINHRGKFDATRPNVRGSGRNQEYILVSANKTGTQRDIVITRKDVNEIMLAKAAIQSGMRVLLKTAGLTVNQINRLIIAGAFGSYLDLNSAIQIGMLPDLPVERFVQVGNAAGSGAKQILCSDEMRSRAAEFSRNSRYVELTEYPEFQEIYISGLNFSKFSS